MWTAAVNFRIVSTPAAYPSYKWVQGSHKTAITEQHGAEPHILSSIVSKHLRIERNEVLVNTMLEFKYSTNGFAKTISKKSDNDHIT